MSIENLKKLAESLINGDGKNNLIKFKESQTSSIEVLRPNYKNVFDSLNSSTKLKIFNEKIDDYFLDNQDDNNDVKYTKEDYINNFESKASKNQILIYNDSQKPFVALRNIMNKGKTFIEETGVNILYCAFGFLHWRESNNSEFIKTPILLKPIKIFNESYNSPYYISESDDETLLNPALKLKFKQNFNINLPDYEDEEDIDCYFDKIRDCVKYNSSFIVKTEVKISGFSFAKINMYNDIINNIELINKNELVSVILGEKDYSNDFVINNSFEHKNELLVTLHNVVDADCSQMEAIEYAKLGKSFVLQGPPGTGKSQTITNIISECLYDGKKVLFVSEKLAALNVVYEKLKQNNLADFCLELHNHKASKKEVISNMNNVLNKNKIEIDRDIVNSLINEKIHDIESLNNYAKEIYKKNDFINLSFYELMSELAKVKTNNQVNYVIKDLDKLSIESFKNNCELLEKFNFFVENIGYDYKQNVWYGLENFNCIPSNKNDFKNKLKNLLTEANKLSDKYTYEIQTYGIVFNELKDIKRFSKFISILNGSKFITPKSFDNVIINYILNNINKLKSYSDIIKNEKTKIDSYFKNSFYDIDYVELLDLLRIKYKNPFNRLFSKDYKEIRYKILKHSNNDKNLNYKKLIKNLSHLENYNLNLEKFFNLEKIFKYSISESYNGYLTNWKELEYEFNNLKLFFDNKEFGKFNKFSNEEYNDYKLEFSSLSEYFNNLYDNLNKFIDEINYFDKDIVNLKNISIEVLIKNITNYINNFDYIDNWCQFNNLLNKLRENNLIDFIDYTIKNSISEKDIANIYKQLYYEEWASIIINKSSILSNFSRKEHDDIISNFVANDKKHFEMNKKLIEEKLSNNIPDINMMVANSPISIIQHQASIQKKHMPIRLLLEKTKDVIFKLKPCFLMSPLSVSTYLNPNINFDVVIFDEASQVTPEDAIGAIYRAKQLIVVGDQKQMPPSNFFNSSINSEDNNYDYNISVYDSLLDLCSVRFPKMQLKWHYRSKYEQLISFSNMHFYNNSLITFPSTFKDKVGIGIDYYHVDGCFDHKSRTNIKEAKYVIDLLFEDLEKYKMEKSIGIVAFSVSQQDCIEKQLYLKRKENQKYEEFFSDNRKEPFFIKNLETVQGDERDIIIFSTGYAKDSDEKLKQNFGPLTNIGGERRLNVAITRAKYNVQLISSMHHYDLNLSNTQSQGIKLLAKYLKYAEEKFLDPYILPKNVSFDSQFEHEVYEFLINNEYEVDTQVGCSSYRIDLALKKRNRNDYALAIECDGASYHSAKNVRERDRLRQEVLESRGWKFYRIWSTDWFYNNQIEKEKLIKAVENALIEDKNILPVNPQNKQPTIEVKTKKKIEFPKYKYVNLNDKLWTNNFRYDFVNTLVELLQIEGPLSIDWFLHRIPHVFLQEKYCKSVKQQFENYKNQIRAKHIVFKNNFIYFENLKISTMRIPEEYASVKRNIEQISLEELAQGIRIIMENNQIAEKQDVFKKVLKFLGISKSSSNAIEILNKSLIYISEIVEEQGDCLKLKI